MAENPRPESQRNPRGTLDRYRNLNVLGGNRAEADAAVDKYYRDNPNKQRRPGDNRIYQGLGYADPETLDSIDAYAKLRRNVLQTDVNQRDALDEQRQIADNVRNRKMRALEAMQGAPSIALAERRVGRDALLRKIAMESGSPQAAIDAQSMSGSELAARALAQQSSEGLQREARYGQGLSAVRGQDLAQVAMEQQLLGDDIGAQAEKEQIANLYTRLALQEKTGMTGAELGVQALHAQQANQPSPWDNLGLGLLNLGATGLTQATLSGGGSAYNQAFGGYASTGRSWWDI